MNNYYSHYIIMNKIKLHVASILLAASMLNVGCMSTVSNSVSDAYGSVRSQFASNKKMSAETDALYAQVDQADKDEIEALQHELEVTKETRVLASLVSKRDDLKQKRSSLDDKRMKVVADEKLYRLKLAKLEAIDRNKLGDKITNIEAITDVHVDALETQQKRLKLDSDIGVLDVHIGRLDEEISAQQAKINQLTGDLDDSPVNGNQTVGYNDRY